MNKIISISILSVAILGAAMIGKTSFADSLLAPSISSTEFQKPETQIILPETYYWKYESSKMVGYVNGDWRNGPSGKGACSLSLSQTSSKEKNVTASISGNYPVGKGNIGAAIGVTIGESKTFGTSYSISVPKGKTQQIVFRAIYKKTEIVQRQWFKTGALSGKTSKTAIAYVTSFDHWEYSYKNV